MLVRRHDVDIVPQYVRGESRWVVREPWSSNTYQLNEHEYFVFCQLTDDWSSDSVRQAFEAKFAPLKLTNAKLFRFIHMLHREGLLTSRDAAQGDVLTERERRHLAARMVAGLANPLAVRIPGIDLSGALSVVAKLLRPLCRWWSLLLWLILMLVTVVWATITRDFWLLELEQLAGGGFAANIGMLLLAIGGTKVLHELGHAVTLHLFGGRCRDIGLMFLVFAPCLYCDVSDAWLFPSKWKRIAVSLAGIVVELSLAVIAFWVWWLTSQGPVHNTALTVMVLCSLNTLLLNGNPLMRYDGYFVLSDWSERPNLAERSRSQVREWMGGRWQGVDAFAVVYGLSSFVYRLVIFSLIFVMLYRRLVPYRLEVLIFVLGLWVLLGAGWNLLRRRQRWSLAAVAVVGVVALACFTPLPAAIQATAVVKPERMELLESQTAGWLGQAAAYGSTVRAGELVATIKSTTLEKELAALDASVTSQQEVVETLREQALSRDDLAVRLRAAQSRLTDLQRQAQMKRQQRERLDLRAPFAGTLLRPGGRLPSDNEFRLAVANRLELPLDPSRRAGHVAAREAIALLAAAGPMEAILLISESDRPHVHVGMEVHLRARSIARRTITGQIQSIAELDAGAVGQPLLATDWVDQLLHAQREATGQPQTRYYAARVKLDDIDARHPWVGTANARISLPPRSIAERLRRWFHEAVMPP